MRSIRPPAQPLALLLCLLLYLPCSAQTTVELRKILTGIDCLENISGNVFVSNDSVPKVETVGYVDLGKIPDKPQSVKLIVTDANRKPITAERIANSVWIIRGTGKVWIDARVIDLPTSFLLDEQYELELPGVLPPPQPPTPDPPQPDPDNPAPMPGDGLKVLIVYEIDQQATYPASQMAQLGSTALRTWLTNTVARAPNGQPEWRVLDQDAVCPVGQPTLWCDALKRPRSTLPWIIISNGKTGFEGPLPQTESDTRKLIETYK
jgi:hypothetical protein